MTTLSKSNGRLIKINAKKQPHYFKSFLLGMSAIILPVLNFGQPIKKIDTEELSDCNKVKKDYLKSFEGIQKGVVEFDYRK